MISIGSLVKVDNSRPTFPWEISLDSVYTVYIIGMVFAQIRAKDGETFLVPQDKLIPVSFVDEDYEVV